MKEEEREERKDTMPTEREEKRRRVIHFYSKHNRHIITIGGDNREKRCLIYGKYNKTKPPARGAPS